MEVLNQQVKQFIKNITFLPSELLHVYGGIFFYLTWLFALKSKYAVHGLLVITCLALGNEFLDLIFYYTKQGIFKWQASLSDLLHTLLLPVVIYYFLKYYQK